MQHVYREDVPLTIDNTQGRFDSAHVHLPHNQWGFTDYEPNTIRS